MKILGSALSPFAARVMIAARLKNIDLEIVETAPRSPELLEKSPIGKIPVLIDGDLVLPESDAILGYFEDRVPAPPLYPGDARERAQVRLMVRLLDAYANQSFGSFLPGADPAETAAAMARISDALRYIDHFRPQGSFAAGRSFSAADCAWIPFFHYFERLDGAHGVFGVVRRYPKLEAWWEQARESELGRFARAAIDKEIMKLMNQRD